MVTPSSRMPALVGWVKLDGELRENMYGALAAANSTSLKVTLSALLNGGLVPAENFLSQYARDELRKLQQQPAPAIVFDLTNNAHRPLFQVLTEIAA